MSNRLPTPWLDPVGVDPALFVNRTEKVKELTDLLGDLVEYKQRKELIVVSGDRGIGKSIFVRKVLHDLRQAARSDLLLLVVDHRGSDDRAILKHFIRALLEAASPLALKRIPGATSWTTEWLDPLGTLLHAGDRLVRATVATKGKEHGVAAELGGGLWAVLQAKFSAQWKEKFEQSQRVETSLEITPEVLHTSICAVLEKMAELVSVVAFFDDVDQATGMENAETAKNTFRAVLDLVPCIGILHLRTEVAGFPDFRREIRRTVKLEGLTNDELRQLFRRRMEVSGPHRRVLELPNALAAFHALMGATDNPYTFLRWADGVVASHDPWPPKPGWDTAPELRRVAIRSLNGPNPDAGLLDRLGEAIDAFGRERGFGADDLKRGRLAVDGRNSTAGLTEAEIKWLRRYDLLIPIDRFDEDAGLRIDPMLRLIQPEVVKLVQQGG